MAGLVWFVQVVHYPLFGAVPAAGFPGYEAAHTRRTTWVVGPLMLAELGTALALLATPIAASHRALVILGLALLVLIWGATWGLQVPRHRELAKGFAARAHRRLVTSNWIRTAGWSVRGIVALTLLAA